MTLRKKQGNIPLLFLIFCDVKIIYAAAFGVALSVGAMATPVQAEEVFTNVTDPTQPFTVVNNIVMKVDLPWVQVVAPNGNEVYAPGEDVTVSWDVSGKGTDFVDVWFSPDGGVTYNTVATRVPSSLGSVRWTLPDVVTREAMFTVEANDLVDVTASDSSDAFFHITTLPAEATSPTTGEDEAVYAVQPGDFVYSPTYPDDGWYIDADLHRRPVLSEGIMLTYVYADATPVVGEVGDATLALLPLAPALVPQPGTVLVKFDDAAAVYAVEGTPEHSWLRQLANEAVAELNYGADWKQYMLEVPAALRRSYAEGSMIVSDIDPWVEGMMVLE